MSTSETLLRARLAGRIDDAEADRALDIALRVEHQCVCPVSGGILDSRTAVGVWTVAPDGTRTCHAVVHPVVFEDRGTQIANLERVLLAEDPELELEVCDVADVWRKVRRRG